MRQFYRKNFRVPMFETDLSLYSGIISPSSDSSGSGLRGHPISASPVSRFSKTRLCSFFLRGVCAKGRNCGFAHFRGELKAPPDLIKTRLCQDWINGICLSRTCNYAHGRKELRFTQDFYKTKLCQFWSQGGCSKAEFCRHAHGVHELRPAPPEPRLNFSSKASSSEGYTDYLQEDDEALYLPKLQSDTPDPKLCECICQLLMESPNTLEYTLNYLRAAMDSKTSCETNFRSHPSGSSVTRPNLYGSPNVNGSPNLYGSPVVGKLNFNSMPKCEKPKPFWTR